MPTVLDWSPTVDPSEFVRTVREVVAAGSPVILPGDCGYVALINPAGPRAAGQLAALGGGPPAVLAWTADDPAGLGLPVSAAARRLMLRGWPAPLVVAVPGSPNWPADWPAAVRERLTAAGPVRFRCPEHPLCEAVTAALDLPVLVADTFRPTAEEALDRLDDGEALAVAAGPVPVGVKPTVVVARPDRCEVTEPGAVPAEDVEKFAARIVLFVCTGNTCRSPLAEGLAKKMLADRLGCGAHELPARGVWVVSAGVSAFGGGRRRKRRWPRPPSTGPTWPTTAAGR